MIWNKIVDWKNLLIAGLTSLFVLWFSWTKKKEGKLELENKLLKEKEVLKNEGRKAAAKEKADTVGLSDSDVRDRLLGRTDDWRRM